MDGKDGLRKEAKQSLLSFPIFFSMVKRYGWFGSV